MKIEYRDKLMSLILIGLFFQLLTACSYLNKPKIDINDGGLLSGKPCSAPCFWSITPGITTKEEATKILKKDLGHYFCDNWDLRNRGGGRGIDCSDIKIDIDDNNIVNILLFNPTQKISVDDVLKKYGEPDGVDFVPLGLSMQPPVVMLLYFRNENMVIHLPQQNDISYYLQSDTVIERIEYLKQSAFDFDFQSTQNWKGYGKY